MSWNRQTRHELLKVDFTDKTGQVSQESVDLGFAIKHAIKVLKKSAKLNGNIFFIICGKDQQRNIL